MRNSFPVKIEAFCGVNEFLRVDDKPFRIQSG